MGSSTPILLISKDFSEDMADKRGHPEEPLAEPQKARFTALELLGVAELPTTVQALRRKAARESWPYEEKPHAGQPLRLYPLSALPPAAQAALLLRQQRQQQSPSPEGKNKPLSLSLSPQGLTARQFWARGGDGGRRRSRSIRGGRGRADGRRGASRVGGHCIASDGRG